MTAIEPGPLAQWLPPTDALDLGSITADVLALSGRALLRGYSVVESAGVPAAAAASLRDGTNANGPVRARIVLAASGALNFAFPTPGIFMERGIFVDVTAGQLSIVLYYTPETRIRHTLVAMQQASLDLIVE